MIAVIFEVQPAEGKRDAEIGIAPALRGLYLEDDGDHGCTSLACGPETCFRNMRSSLRMNRSRLANS